MSRQIIAGNKWKSVNFKNNNDDNDNIFKNLIEFQELTEYEITSIKQSSKKRSKALIDEEGVTVKKRKSKIPKQKKSGNKINGNNCPQHQENKDINAYNSTIRSTKHNEIEISKSIASHTAIKQSLKSNGKSTSTFNKSPSKSSRKQSARISTDTTGALLPCIQSDVAVNDDILCDDENDSLDMSMWLNLCIPDVVLKALSDLKFKSPTPIQTQALPYAIRDRVDIIGAAQTGSGKTLAFVIPILHHILESKIKNPADKKLFSVIVTPTRELAIQIREHFKAAAKYTDIKCIALVGGMSIDKQNRQLGYKPEVIVATPGRLWELMEQKHDHLEAVDKLQCLVIDEADRLIQQGHYKELTQILNVINSNDEYKQLRQNFIYSATLTFVHDKPKRLNPKKMKKLKDISLDDKLATIASLIGLRDKCRLIDLTSKNQMTDHLKEFQVRCTYDEKDIHLYYLIRYLPCRRLVFTNSKDAVRRVSNILSVLDCKVFPLHADMQQKQRLKNLDKFRGNDDSILLATDVAARGLDITDVQQVVHYHVPKTTEIYVHRSGRTARSDKSGSSVVLVSPEEIQAFKKIISSLKKNVEPPSLEINIENYTACKSIVKLAIQIEKEEHSESKFEARNRWFKQAAIEAELNPDDSISEDEEDMLNRNKTKSHLKEMRQQLSHLLNRRRKNKKRRKKLYS